MSTILRTFCVVSCLISGIYASIIYYYFRNAKRMLWFAILCFALCININMSMGFYPGVLFDAEYVAGISDNIFFATHALVTLFLSIYSQSMSIKLNFRFQHAFNYLCLLLIGISMIIPDSMEIPMFILLCAFSMFSYLLCLYRSIKVIQSGDKSHWHPALAYVLLILSTTIENILIFNGFNVFSIRALCAPVFLALHGIMLTSQYKQSLSKTQTLSASLQETIERINHSDNALMCTQMKADFLYKSLDLISRRCDEDPFSAEDLTVSLSKYLRHTLNFQQLQGIVPLSNEIELTKSYIAIEKERNSKLSFEYKFPNPLPDFHIPPLSIQPLVENAIEHAFPPEQENPKITITIIPYRDYFHIDVSDNGEGMDEDMVKTLTDSLHGNARIGIYNIHTRLVNLFGKGLVIQSAPGVGTSVSFVVPPDAIAYLKEKEEQS